MLIPVSERFSINTEQFFVQEMRSALRLTVNRFARLLSIKISPFHIQFQVVTQKSIKTLYKKGSNLSRKVEFAASVCDLFDIHQMHG
jgi:hypothetical protein